MAFSIRVKQPAPATGWDDYTGMVRPGSLLVLDELNGPSTASFDLVDKTSTAVPAVGSTVLIQHGGNELFAGQIDKPKKRRVNGTTMHDWHIQCVDFSCVLGRRTYTGTIAAGTTLAGAVTTIANAALAGEGFTTAGVATGPTLPKLQFQRLPVAECFNELSRLTGYKWRVTYDSDTNTKVIQFKDRATEAAPWALTSLNQILSFDYERERSQYRNVQRILGTKVTASKATTVRWTADGKSRSFSLQRGTTVSGTAYDEIASVSLLTVTDAAGQPVAQLIGTPGVPTNQWEYSVGGNSISLVSEEPTPAAGRIIELTYIGRLRIEGMYPPKDQWATNAQILERKKYEGGTGIYEAVEVDESIDNAGTATAKAKALIDLHGHLPTIINTETYIGGLKPGQMWTVNLTNYGINTQFLIDSVQIQDVPALGEGYQLKYSIRCVASEVPKWQGYFAALLRTREAPKAEAWDEYQTDIYAPTDVLGISDTLTVTPSAYADSEVDVAVVGFAEVS